MLLTCLIRQSAFRLPCTPLPNATNVFKILYIPYKDLAIHSDATLNVDVEPPSLRKPYVRDKFLQPIDHPQVLDHFPDFTVIGQVKGKYGPEEPNKFAVIQLGAHQFKVVSKDLIYTEKIRAVNVKDKVRLGKVLMWGSKEQTIIGRPFIQGASVIGIVEEQCQDAKVLIFKKKRRKNHRRTKGHRQELTGVRITEICSIDDIVNFHQKDEVVMEPKYN